MNVFTYKNQLYPDYIRRGNACAYVLPFARQFCQGHGLDVGGTKEWSLPGARIVNILQPDGHHAENIPPGPHNFIFSSHTLEHVSNYVSVLNHWLEHLKQGGVLFLYLPHPDMEYWLPQNNRKHLHSFDPKDLAKTVLDLGFTKVFHSERDLYWSFSIVAQKP